MTLINVPVIYKIVEVAKTREFRDEEQAIVKNLTVQRLLIRHECCFSLSNGSKAMK